MKKWEYKTEFRKRDAKSKHWDNDILGKLGEIGMEGWELVSISPRCGDIDSGNFKFVYHNTAGYTDEELWVFKRQVE